MNDDPSAPEIAAFFNDNEKLLKAMGRGVQKALRMHKLLGHPIVTWRDGKVVWIPPEEIELDESLLHEGDGRPDEQ